MSPATATGLLVAELTSTPSSGSRAGPIRPTEAPPPLPSPTAVEAQAAEARGQVTQNGLPDVVMIHSDQEEEGDGLLVEQRSENEPNQHTPRSTR